MSREIKFRGLHEGKWVYGSYLTDGADYHAIMAIVKSLCGDEYMKITKRVDKESVGQFTGSYGIGDSEIFQGDRTKVYHYEDAATGDDKYLYHSVVWHQKLNQWYMLNSDCTSLDDKQGGNIALWVGQKTNPGLEVIGNVHEQGEKQ